MAKRKHDDGLPELVYLEHGTYYYRPRRGKRVNLGRARPAALIAHAKLLQGQGIAQNPASGRIGHYMDVYTRDEIPLKAPGTHRDLLRQMANLRSVFGAMHPADVHPTDVYAYLKARAAAPGQANQEKALLSHLYTKMLEWGAAKVNPCIGVKKFSIPARTRAPSLKELADFCALAQPIVGLYIQFKLATGLRKADILALPPIPDTATDFALEIGKSRRLNRSTGLRAGKRRRYLITPPLRALLARLDGLADHPKTPKGKPRPPRQALFCTRTGTPYTTDGFDCLLKTAYARWAAAGGERFHEHDIRATTATADKEGAQLRLGHTKQSTTDIYLRAFDVPTVTPLDTQIG